MANKTIRPLHDRVLVSRTEEETTTQGGIILTGESTEKPSQGTVIAVGPGKTRDNGTIQELSVNVGDVVIFGQYAGSAVKLEGTEYLVITEGEIHAVIEG